MEFFSDGIDTKTLANEGAELSLLRADGSPFVDKDGKQITITLYGADSTIARDAQKKAREERQNFLAAGGTDTDELVEERNCLWYARMTRAWSVKLADGKPAPSNVETFAAFYRQFPTVADQVDAFISRRINFMKRP